MENYQIALNKFLDRYRKKKWYRGAILCGSYATGNNNINSDIDCYIISDDTVNWRERGNYLLDGYLFEYFINPPKKIKEYIVDECIKLSKSTTNMFIYGKIIDDKEGFVNELKQYAIMFRSVRKSADKATYLMNCYSIWDSFDELDYKYMENLDIDYQYYTFLTYAYKSYCYNSRIQSVPISKLEIVLTNPKFRSKYGVKLNLDKEVEKLLKIAFKEKDREKRYKTAKKSRDYLLNLYNFDICTFSLKTKI